MVTSVTSFMDDREAARELDELIEVRNTAIDIAYDVPGYVHASLACKNWLYDVIRDRVLAAQEAARDTL